mmetsp:Transcript_14156/g.33042  ORF Transcript_14156/g.33042 Transcript_14156/m.33042 type:complete len:235 (-) Transcript_14156:43-747(-)
MSITSGRLHLEDAIIDGQQGHIESATTQVEDQNVALARTLLVQTVGNGSSSWLVDDAQNVQTGDDTSILGGLALRVVEVGGHGDDSVLHLLAKVRLSSFLHLQEHHRRDLLGSEGLLLSLEVHLDDGLGCLLGHHLERPVLHVTLDGWVLELASNQALGVEHSVGGVHRDLVLRGIANQALGVGETDVRRRGAVALVVGDDLHAFILPNADARVCCAEVNADGNSLCFLVTHCC